MCRGKNGNLLPGFDEILQRLIMSDMLEPKLYKKNIFNSRTPCVSTCSPRFALAHIPPTGDHTPLKIYKTLKKIR